MQVYSTDILTIISNSDKGICETISIHGANIAIINGIIIIITIIIELEMDIITLYKQPMIKNLKHLACGQGYLVNVQIPNRSHHNDFNMVKYYPCTKTAITSHSKPI